MAASILKCYDPFTQGNANATAQYNLLYCFVADENQVELVAADNIGDPLGDSRKYLDFVVSLYYPNSKPTTPHAWLKAASGKLMFLGVVDDAYDSFEEARAAAKDFCNDAEESKAVAKRYGYYRYGASEPKNDPLSYENLYKNKKPIIAAAESGECPPATQDIGLNLENRQHAIETAGYGPLNPAEPNEEFWQEKADRWSVSVEEAKTSRCGNCAAFIITPRMKDCIASGLGNESGNSAWSTVDAGELGYCEAFDFKCAAARTCDAWISGGPVTEEKE